MLATPQDAGRTATEQKDAFKSSAGGFTYRHHVALRGQMYLRNEPSFPILVKYGDAIRQTKTTSEKKNIGDCWDVDGTKTLSVEWIGFSGIETRRKRPPRSHNFEETMSKTTQDAKQCSPNKEHPRLS